MKKLHLSFLLFTVISMCSFAQPLPLSKAINLALSNAPALKVSQDKINLSESKLKQAHEQQLPFSKVSASWSQFNLISPFALTLPGSAEPAFGIGSGAFDATMASATVAEELFGGFRIRNSIKSADFALQSSKIELRGDSERIAFSITSAYYQVYKILKAKQLLADNIKALSSKLKEISSLEKSGLALHNDILRVQLQISNMELAQKEADAAYRVAMYSISVVTGITDTAAFELDTTGLLSQSYSAPDLADFNNTALTSRSELQAAGWQIKAAQTGLEILKSNHYPHLSVSTGYNYIHPGLSLIPEKKSFISAWNIGINVSYNISSLYADKGKMMEAHNQVKLLRDAKELKESQIKTEVFKDYNDWLLSKDKIRLTIKAIAQAEENYRVQESGYRNSISTLSDLMEANTLLLQARMNKMNAEADALLAYQRLIFASGQWNKNRNK